MGAERSAASCVAIMSHFMIPDRWRELSGERRRRSSADGLMDRQIADEFVTLYDEIGE